MAVGTSSNCIALIANRACFSAPPRTFVSKRGETGFISCVGGDWMETGPGTFMEGRTIGGEVLMIPVGGEVLMIPVGGEVLIPAEGTSGLASNCPE